jgi:hypothetical protein
MHFLHEVCLPHGVCNPLSRKLERRRSQGDVLCQPRGCPNGSELRGLSSRAHSAVRVSVRTEQCQRLADRDLVHRERVRRFLHSIAVRGVRVWMACVRLGLSDLLHQVRGALVLKKMVTQIFTSWNRIVDWLGQIDGLQQAA